MVLEWLRARMAEGEQAGGEGPARQGSLFASAPYREDAPAIAGAAEWAGAIEHLEYAIFRRYENQLTRAERARLDNTIQNVLFKAERYASRLEAGPARERAEAELQALRAKVLGARELAEKLRGQARRADLKLAQLDSLTPEGFEEFVAELFEALGFEVEVVGGTGDEGIDLRVRRQGLLGVVQCKYKKQGVVGSPEVQKFLGTVHHTRSHKGFFVTTRTFTLAAERFAADHPIELVDGPRLVEMVREALGPGVRREPEPAWF
jgi:restriction system protein